MTIESKLLNQFERSWYHSFQMTMFDLMKSKYAILFEYQSIENRALRYFFFFFFFFGGAPVLFNHLYANNGPRHLSIPHPSLLSPFHFKTQDRLRVYTISPFSTRVIWDGTIRWSRGDTRAGFYPLSIETRPLDGLKGVWERPTLYRVRPQASQARHVSGSNLVTGLVCRDTINTQKIKAGKNYHLLLF